MENRTISREQFQAPPIARTNKAKNANYQSSVFLDKSETDYTTVNQETFTRKPIDKGQKDYAKSMRNHLLEPHIALGSTEVEYKSSLRDTFTLPPDSLYRNRPKFSDPSKKDNITFGSDDVSLVVIFLPQLNASSLQIKLTSKE